MKYYVVDAFTSEHFCGNPAGVCLIDKWLEPEIMQKIAAENRLSETAFVKPRADGSFDIRWFTPGAEVNLCGHATLASSYILGRFIEPKQQTFVLHSHMSGDLTAIRLPDGRYELDFPAWQLKPVEITPSICEALGFEPKGVWLTRDLVVQAEHEEIIRNFQPDLQAICNLDGLGLLLTAKGSKSDFVCRTFFPKIAVDEDPVCGSANCTLVPLWSHLLGKDELINYQLSPRTGIVYCKMGKHRVKISGHVCLYMSGEIQI